MSVVVGTLPMKERSNTMLKLYVVARVYLLLRQGRVIDSIRMVRARLGKAYHVDGFMRAKRFVDEVRNNVWPYTY